MEIAYRNKITTQYASAIRSGKELGVETYLFRGVRKPEGAHGRGYRTELSPGAVREIRKKKLTYSYLMAKYHIGTKKIAQIRRRELYADVR